MEAIHVILKSISTHGVLPEDAAMLVCISVAMVKTLVTPGLQAPADAGANERMTICPQSTDSTML